MELRILYQCPSCNQKLAQSLLELKPGQNRDCLDCGSPVALTDESLSNLRQDLHDAYRH